jgi:hypothetical protein
MREQPESAFGYPLPQIVNEALSGYAADDREIVGPSLLPPGTSTEIPGRQNQALEQTRDSVLRYGESFGCELLNFFVLPRGPQIALLRTPRVSRIRSISTR